MGYLRCYVGNMWLFVPVQGVIKEFLSTIDDYPFQAGATLNAAGINYHSLRAEAIMRRIENTDGFSRPGN